MEQLAINKERVLSKYIDMMYFYLGERYDYVKINLEKIIDGEQSVIPADFRLFDENGHELSREDVYKILNEAILENIDAIGDLEIYVVETIDSNNQKRHNGLLPIAVENEFHDKVYYNHQMLEFLREEFGRVKNIIVVVKAYFARVEARRNQEEIKKEWPDAQADYTTSDDILFKEYYLPKYEEKYRTKEEYEMECKKVEAMGLRPVTYEEFLFNSISIRMNQEKFVREKK